MLPRPLRGTAPPCGQARKKATGDYSRRWLFHCSGLFFYLQLDLADRALSVQANIELFNSTLAARALDWRRAFLLNCTSFLYAISRSWLLRIGGNLLEDFHACTKAHENQQWCQEHKQSVNSSEYPEEYHYNTSDLCPIRPVHNRLLCFLLPITRSATTSLTILSSVPVCRAIAATASDSVMSRLSILSRIIIGVLDSIG